MGSRCSRRLGRNCSPKSNGDPDLICTRRRQAQCHDSSRPKIARQFMTASATNATPERANPSRFCAETMKLAPEGKTVA